MARFEHPHDRQMRRVPDRPGLLARLRDVAVADDALDEWLMITPACDGLESRIREAVLADTSEVAQLLNDIPVPDGLLERLQEAIVDEMLSDSGMTEMLQDVEPSDSAVNLEAMLSGGLPSDDGDLNEISKHVDAAARVDRVWRPVAERRRRVNRWFGSAVAVGAVFVQAAVLLAVAFIGNPPSSDVIHLTAPTAGPLELAAQRGDAFVLVGVSPVQTQLEPSEDPVRIELENFELPQRGPVEEMIVVSRETDMSQDIWPARMEHVGYPTRELETVRELSAASPPSKGGAPLGKRGYDRLFHFRTGSSPWVIASALPKQSLTLQSQPEVFRRVLQRIAQGQSVGPDEVRVEDALGLLSIPASSTAGRLGLLTTGGPSAFGETGAGLLQLSVIAGASADQPIAPVDLVVVMDASERMTWSSLQRVRAALLATLRAMRAEDRLTILTVGGAPQVLCDRAGVDELAEVDQVLASLEPEGIADWGRAVPMAARTTMEHEEGAHGRRVLLLIGSGEGEWAESAEPFMAAELANLQSQMDVRACVLSSGHSNQGPDPDSRWQQWLLAHDTPLRTGANAVRGALLDATAGRVVPVGKNVRFEIEFNPKAVVAYRVIGQDGSPADWSSVPQSLDLFAGDQHNSLLELRWGVEDVDTVGWAEVRWQDAHGHQHKQRQRISRLQFATSFTQSAASLQQASLFAEAAQVWRGSPFAPGVKRRLDRVRDMLWECAPEVRNSPETQRLMQAISRSLQDAASTNN